MKTKYLTSLLLLVVACSGGQTTGGNDGQGETKVALKKAAAAAKASGTAQGDVCAERGWYGDSECDTFCQAVDSVDCTPDTGDDIVCAAFVEEPNGFCDRKVCLSQDPDCSGTEPGDPGTGDPDDPIACPAIAQEPDGVCNADAKDVCDFYSDPDCAAVDPLPGEPSPEPTDPAPPSCKVAPEAADGVCSREANDPCLAADPDCIGVACAAYIELSDGACKREPNDPCIFQDPDCRTK